MAAKVTKKYLMDLCEEHEQAIRALGEHQHKSGNSGMLEQMYIEHLRKLEQETILCLKLWLGINSVDKSKGDP